MEDFYKTIKLIVNDNPNDSVLGHKVRRMIWDIEKENEKKVNAMKRSSNQIDLEDLINDIKNGD
jgi:hypothetical protein